jgi:Domain of unknown function (DUF4395)
MFRPSFGEALEGVVVQGHPITAAVFDERQVRAAAGVTLVLGAVAFGYAYFAQEYRPIQVVTGFFLLEFALRVSLGLRYSPVGRIARLLTRRGSPEWVSAKPKRFAWSLGLAMSLAMTIIANNQVRGALPLTICLICLALMWLEAVLGLCLGCELYALLVRRGWVARDKAIEICSGGACTPPDRN